MYGRVTKAWPDPLRNAQLKLKNGLNGLPAIFSPLKLMEALFRKKQ
jgi:hypothetical protein